MISVYSGMFFNVNDTQVYWKVEHIAVNSLYQFLYNMKCWNVISVIVFIFSYLLAWARSNHRNYENALT
jgi:hypothetical protein